MALFGDDFGSSGSGLEWLKKFSDSANFPATVLIIAKSDAQLTSKALKLGVHDVLIKRDLSAEGLCESVNAAAASERSSAPMAEGDRAGTSDAEIVAKVCQEGSDGESYKFKRLIGQFEYFSLFCNR